MNENQKEKTKKGKNALKENARDTKVADVFAAVLCEITATKCGGEKGDRKPQKKEIFPALNANAHEKGKLCLFVCEPIEEMCLLVMRMAAIDRDS